MFYVTSKSCILYVISLNIFLTTVMNRKDAQLKIVWSKSLAYLFLNCNITYQI